MIVTNLSDI